MHSSSRTCAEHGRKVLFKCSVRRRLLRAIAQRYNCPVFNVPPTLLLTPPRAAKRRESAGTPILGILTVHHTFPRSDDARMRCMFF